MKRVKKFIPFILIIVCITAAIFILNKYSHTVYNEETAAGNTAGNLFNGGYYSEYDGRIYFSNQKDDGTLYSMNLDLSDLKKLSNDKVGYINVTGNYLYYIRMNYSKTKNKGDALSFKNAGIFRINLDGSRLINLYDDPSGLINLYGNSIYYQHFNNDDGLKFYKVDIDKKNEAKLSDSPIMPISISDGLLYYSGVSNNHAIYTMNLSTGQYNLLSKVEAYAPMVQGDSIYYMSLDNNYAIYRMGKDGINPQEVVKERCSTFNITPDGKYMYYQVDDTKNNSLCCMNLSTGEMQVLMEGDYKEIHIAGGRVFFSDFNETTQYYTTIGFRTLILEFNPEIIKK